MRSNSFSPLQEEMGFEHAVSLLPIP